MARVTIEVWPHLSELFGGSGNTRHVLEVEIEEGTTLEALLEQLARKNDKLRSAIYEPGSKDISDYISAVINGRLSELLDGYGTRLRDGDRVMLVHGFAGG